MRFLSKYTTLLFCLPTFLVLAACKPLPTQSLSTQSLSTLSPLSMPVSSDTLLRNRSLDDVPLDERWKPVEGELTFIEKKWEEDQFTSYKMVTRNISASTQLGKKLFSFGMEHQAGYRSYEGDRLPDKFFSRQALGNLLSDINIRMNNSIYLVGDQAFGIGMGSSWRTAARPLDAEARMKPFFDSGRIAFTPLQFELLLQEPPTAFNIETINGVETYYYGYRSNEVSPLLQEMLEIQDNGGTIEELAVDLWIMPESNLVIKYVIESIESIRYEDESTSALKPDGDFTHKSYEISNINTDYVIELPAEALAEFENFHQVAQTGELILPRSRCAECILPVPVGSIIYGYNKMGNLRGIEKDNFTIDAPSPLTLEEVKDLYTEKLPEYGWTIEPSQVSFLPPTFEVTNGIEQFRIYVSQSNADEPVEISINQ